MTRQIPRTVHDLAADPAYEYVATFRIAGGRAIYDTAQYLERGRYQSVLVSALRDGRVITRWLDPDTEVEVVEVMVASHGDSGYYYDAIRPVEEAP